MYLVLAAILFGTLAIGTVVTFGLIYNRPYWSSIAKLYVCWMALYFLFIAFGTGPTGERMSLFSKTSPYKLPWKAKISRFTSQGNRSFTSHRGANLYAWDFWMPIGTEIFASRSGTVIELKQSFSGIGLKSNFLVIKHDDGTHAMYAHIKRNGSVVEINDYVEQGQLIAYSGMVGQTINPHLHFVVFDKSRTNSLPITFADVSGGVPFAGRFYTSGNIGSSSTE